MLLYILLTLTISSTLSNNSKKRVVLYTGPAWEYNYFPLKCDYMEMIVETPKNIDIILSNSYTYTGKLYEICIDDYLTNKSLISVGRYDKKNFKATYEDQVLEGDLQHHKLYLALDHDRGAISVGKVGHFKPFLHYVDPDYTVMNYIGFSTYQNTGQWYIDHGIFDCQDKYGNVYHNSNI